MPFPQAPITLSQFSVLIARNIRNVPNFTLYLRRLSCISWELVSLLPACKDPR